MIASNDSSISKGTPADERLCVEVSSHAVNPVHSVGGESQDLN